MGRDCPNLSLHPESLRRPGAPAVGAPMLPHLPHLPVLRLLRGPGWGCGGLEPPHTAPAHGRAAEAPPAQAGHLVGVSGWVGRCEGRFPCPGMRFSGPQGKGSVFLALWLIREGEFLGPHRPRGNSVYNERTREHFTPSQEGAVGLLGRRVCPTPRGVSVILASCPSNTTGSP